MDAELPDERDGFDGLWAQMRAEERADRLSQIVQDTVRDAQLADALAAGQVRHGGGG